MSYISPLSAQIGFITSFFVLGKRFVKLFSSKVKMEKAKPEQIEIQDTNKINSTDLIISKAIQECYISEKKVMYLLIKK